MSLSITGQPDMEKLHVRMDTEMKVEMLIATMNQPDCRLLDRMNIGTRAVVINQVTKQTALPPPVENQAVKFISVRDRGLSKSRNMAIAHASADICVIGDDDLIYYDSAPGSIMQAYERNPEADLIIFCYDTAGRHQKAFHSKPKRLGLLDTMKVSSVQITFKRESILRAGIRFNERFGAGSASYQSGEENIFLMQCLQKGLHIYFEPVSILAMEDTGHSTWFQGFNQKLFFDKGATFSALSETYCHILIWQYAVRKYRLYRKETSFLQAVRAMYHGRRDYLQSSNSVPGQPL